MKTAVSLLVGVEAHSRAIAQGAARLAFPGSVVAAYHSLGEALQCEPAPGGELLLLANPDKGSVAKAVGAADASGLRRWAIVIIGAAPGIEGVEIVSPEEVSEPLLARVFRSAVAQHQLLRENARLEGDLRTLAYRISHDMRTPLGGILSAGEVLKEVLMEKDPSSAPLTQPIFDSTDEILKLIARVSSLLKASVNPQAKTRVAMGEVVEAVLQRLESRMIKKGASVSQPDGWPEVAGVGSWLETVWWNLFVNALHHGGQSPRIHTGWQRHDGGYRFWIRDDGSGVTPQECNKLLQPFNLLHQPDSTRGLGLSIVQRLVDLLGGHCGYEPASAGGPAFFFTLPFSDVVSDEPSRKLAAS